MATKTEQKCVQVKAPNMQTGVFQMVGTAPLVIHRFSVKTKNEMTLKMETGKAAGNKKNREAKDMDQAYKDSRYVSKEGRLLYERKRERNHKARKRMVAAR